MKEQEKSKKQLIDELNQAHKEISRLKACKGITENLIHDNTNINEDAIVHDHNRLKKLLTSLDTGLSFINRDMTIAWANNAIKTMFLHANPEGKACYQIYANLQEPCKDCPTLKAFNSAEPYSSEKYSPKYDRWYSIYSQPVLDDSGNVAQVLEEITDITEHKRTKKEQASLRARLEAILHISHMVEASHQELCDLTLHQIQHLTNSTYSFFGFINKDESDMAIYSWSKDTMAECKVSDKPFHFPLDRAGIWARPVIERQAVIINDYEKETTQNRSLPDGHVPIRRMASVPIIQNEKIVAIAAVANKPDAYTNEDIAQIQAFTSSIMLLLDKRQIENQLKASEERLTLALDTINEGVWDWRIDAGEVHYNSTWYTLLDYKPYELPQEFDTWRQLVHPDDMPHAKQTISQSIENASPFDMEFRMRGKHGNWRLINARGRVVEQDKEGKSVRMIGTHTDVTERRFAEKDLISKKNVLSSIFRAAPVGIGIVNNRIITKVNDFFCEMLGYSHYELIGKDARIVYPSQDEFEWVGIEKYKQIRKQGIGTVETKLQRKDGSIIDVILSSTPMDTSDISKGVTFTATEITQLKQAQIRADAANKAKSVFLANMSHEIRTPLNGVIGMLQLLKTTELNEDQNKFADIAIQSSRRLTRLLSDILDISRIEAGKLTMSVEQFDFQDVTSAVVELFEPSAREKNLDLRMHISPDIPKKLRGDSPRLQQILSNIVGNAIKFTSSGYIEIDAHPLPLHKRDECRVLFSISDTGIGINNKILDNLFAPFSQAEESYNRQFQGAGLGLTICKRLVSLMEGTMAVESEEGLGSTFHLCIPFNIAEQTPLVDGNSRSNTHPKGIKILVAEDDFTSRIVVAEHLSKLGHQAIAVNDGKQAIAKLQEEPFDLLLMDIQMPVLNGVEATKAIRHGDAGNKNKGIPIIAMTAYAMAGDKETLLKEGMDEYIAKPLNLEQLEALIKKAILHSNSQATPQNHIENRKGHRLENKTNA